MSAKFGAEQRKYFARFDLVGEGAFNARDKTALPCLPADTEFLPRCTECIGNIVPSSLPSRGDGLGKRRCAVRVCITAAAQCERMYYAYIPRVA